MDAITVAHDGDIQMIDSTSVRVHQQAATAKRGVKITVSVAPGAGSRRGASVVPHSFDGEPSHSPANSTEAEYGRTSRVTLP
jgi:hypothetical protein